MAQTEYQKAYYREHRPAILVARQMWYAKNKTRILSYQRGFRAGEGAATRRIYQSWYDGRPDVKYHKYIRDLRKRIDQKTAQLEATS